MSRRLRSAILWGAGLLAAAALAALAVLSIAIHRVVTPDLVAERASAALGREVSVGAVGLSLQPMLRIRLECVSIAPDITLEKADLALRISSLLERRIEVAFVEVEDASLTLVRRADGGIELYGATHEEGEKARESGGDSEPGAAPASLALPGIELRRVAIAFEDRAVADPPLRIPFRVERLELEPVAAGVRPSLSVAAAVGEHGEGGRLSLEAEVGPLEAEEPIDQHPFRARLELRSVNPAPFVPYLPSRLDAHRLEGVLEGSIAVEGRARGDLTADLALSLVEGGADLAGVGLSSPRYEGRVRRTDGSFRVEEARLQAPLVEFGEHRLRGVRAAFGFAEGTVELESLELDSLSGSWRPAGTATPGEGRAADLELHVQRTGPVALRGRLRLPSGTGESGGRRLDVELPEVEVRDAEVEVVDRARPALPPARLRVDRLRLRDLAEGEVASCSLAARLGQGGRAGSLSLDGELGPLAWERPLAELPFALELAVGEMDPKWVASYVPERWRPSRIEGLLTAKIDAEGPARSGSAQIDVALEGGGIEIAGVELAGRTTFAGRIRRAGDALGVEAGRLTAEGLSFGGRRGEALRAGFGLANGTVEIEFLDLRAYDGTLHQAGRLVLGQVPEFDLRVEAAGVDASRLLGVAVEGAGPTLLEGEATVRGRWTGQPNWLEPVRGEGRVLLRGGVLPSQNLLIAVSRALLSLVPGSPTLLRERPRLARLERMTATFRAETGRVRTDDLRVWTDDFRVSGRGSVGHGGDLDCSLEVVLTGRGVGKAFVLALTNQQLRDAAKLPAVPVRVKGPAGSPSFRADVSSVPVALLRGVLGIPGRAGAAALGVVGTGRDAAGAVGGGVNRTVRRLRGGRERAEPTPDALP